jgi:UPF0042 nucleotide-binding protein
VDFVIITGLSGAGKTGALHAMEDIGYYCVDNLPSDLLRTFYNLCETSRDDAMKRVAVVIDVRGGDNMQNLYSEIKAFREEKKDFRVRFLDANFNSLVTRFKETRRRHPLTDISADNSMEGALALEASYLHPFKKLSDYIIDTTHITVKQLKERISQIFLNSVQKSIVLTFMSFGFKYGIPVDCDSVFDVRCLPNPFYVAELRPKTGLDKEVYDYVFNSEDTKTFVDNLVQYLDFAVPLYVKEGKVEFVAGIGCTGGQHRSVAIAKLLTEHFKEKGYKTILTHRDMNK